MIMENTFIIGREHHLVATLTYAQAKDNAPPPFVLLLTNSGVIPRVGPHRINVHLARQFAALGVPSIRYDMSGLGDSLRASGTASMMEQWVADARDAMQFAQEQFACTRFVMIGFCSGAEVAYKTALQDERLAGAVLWDLYAYPTLQSRVRALIFRARRAVLRVGVQKALAKLGVGAAAAPKAPTARVQTFEPSKIPEAQEFAADLKSLAQRGTAVLVLHCGGEPEWYNYRGQFDATLGRLGLRGQVDFDFLEQTDHLLTREAAQRMFIQTITQWLHKRRLLPL
jgi:alpha-beta hydrolase superfamily lysophospholipase